MTLDDELRFHHDNEMADYRAQFEVEKARLAKLNSAELRVLLVHFKFAEAGRDAKSWSRADMIDGLAEQFMSNHS